MSAKPKSGGPRLLPPKTAALFPTAASAVDLPDTGIVDRLMPAVEAIRRDVKGPPPRAWASPLYTTVETEHRLHLRPAFAELAALLQREIDAMATELAIDANRSPLVLGRSWLCVLERGQSMDVHLQPNSVLTGYLFLTAPEGTARLGLHALTAETGLALYVEENTELNLTELAFRPKIGALLLFESHIPQGFTVHEADDPLIVIGFTGTIKGLERI